MTEEYIPEMSPEDATSPLEKGIHLSSLGLVGVGYKEHIMFVKEERNDSSDFNESWQRPTADEHVVSSNELTAVTNCKHCAIAANRSGQTTNLYHCRLCHGNFFSLKRLMTHSIDHTASGSAASLKGKDLVPMETDSLYDKKRKRKYVWLNEIEKYQPRVTCERKFECGICAKKFKTSGNLEQHMRVHTGEKPYGCDLCGKRFIQKSGLDQHTRIHTGEKPYLCTNCGKAFRQKSGLQQHERVHIGKKPYVCEKCNSSFTQMSGLQSHKFHCS